MGLQRYNVVEKRNILNEMRATQLSLVELRFLTIYLSKINARDISTRTVRFPLTDFVKIMEIQKVNVSAMKATAHRLLSHIVSIPNLETGGFTAFQLFKECRVDKDENEDWYVDIDAHDKALPLMFEFKRDYFKYELWNALRLKSSNQVRIYEILKQHEYKGGHTIILDDFKAMIGLGKGAYPLYADFRRDVLEKAQKSLQETTDICFSYETIRKGRGGKVVAIRFTIAKNEDYIDQLTLYEFINLQSVVEVEDEDAIGEAFSGYNQPDTERNIGIDFDMLSEAFCDEFNLWQVEELYRIALPYIQQSHPGENIHGIMLKMYEFFLLKYAQLKAYPHQIKKSRYGLLKAFIKADSDA